MTKLALITQASSYSVAPGTAVIATKLDGGRSRQRRDILNPATAVSVTWILKRDQFDYLMAFFHTTIEEGALPFEIDLIIDAAAKAEYTANFVPSSLKLTGQSGDTFTVSAQLEVESIQRDATDDADIVATYNAAHGL